MPRARKLEATRRTTMDLPESLIERLDIYVGATNRTRVAVMCEALAEYLDRQENAVRVKMAGMPRWDR